MEHQDTKQSLSQIKLALTAMSGAALAAMVVLHPYDLSLVKALSSSAYQAQFLHEWGVDLKSFSQIQHQTLFNDGLMGSSDISLLFSIIFALVALASYRFKSLAALRNYALFVSVSSVYTAGLLSQGIKFAWGRARPYMVLKNEESLALHSEWFEPGELYLSSGRFAGSFPSGHTASAAILFAIVFWIPKCQSKLVSKFVSLLLLLVAALFWLLMGLGRVVQKAHYATDTLASGILVIGSLLMWASIFGISGDLMQPQNSVSETPWKKIGLVFFATAALLFLIGLARECVHIM